MVMIKSTSMILVNVLVHVNQLLWYFCSFPSTSTVTSSFSEKKSAVSKTLFFHFICVVVKTKSLMIFPLSCNYNNYMTVRTTDRIPHSLIFKRMQIKRIADILRVFSFFIDKLEHLTRREFIVEPSFFHKLDNKKWKIRTGARATKQNCISIYISLYMKTFLKTGVYIHIYIYIIADQDRARYSVCSAQEKCVSLAERCTTDSKISFSSVRIQVIF